MPLIELSTFNMWLAIIFTWAGIQAGSARLVQLLPERFFLNHRRLFRTYAWERNGRFYERWFRVKSWKPLLPDGGAHFKGGYSRKTVDTGSAEALEEHLRQSYRGEYAHWVNLVLVLVFPVFTRPYLLPLMLFYALITNLPCLIAYRYNRPRLQTVLKRQKQKEARQALLIQDMAARTAGVRHDDGGPVRSLAITGLEEANSEQVI